jgi:hypothetical protein
MGVILNLQELAIEAKKEKLEKFDYRQRRRIYIKEGACHQAASNCDDHRASYVLWVDTSRVL